MSQNYEKPNKEDSSKLIFEHGGLLVYDIKGAVAEENLQLSTLTNNPSKFEKNTLNYLNLCKNTDYKLSKDMKNYPPSPEFVIEYLFKFPNDNTTLVFNSKFESGNLSKSIKMSDYEYKLFINNDVGNKSYNHWFYFSVKNPRKSTVTFNIVNLKKKDVLYTEGMKPAVFSTKTSETTGIKWHRDCSNISYTRNIKTNSIEKSYSLSFTYSFKYEHDTVYFAYSIPYTFTDLSIYLTQLKETYDDILKVDNLCYTLAKNECPIITITDSVKDYVSSEYEQNLLNVSSNTRKLIKIRKWKKGQFYKFSDTCKPKHSVKKGVVLMSRVHSGETVGSFMIKGAIDFLVSNTFEAQKLRKKIVFKIIPMLNPDGVRYGNYRSSLLGVDLNRRWKKPHKFLHPTIFYAKKMIEIFKEFHDVKFICDMHGHTKKFYSFMYGCCDNPYDYLMNKQNLLAKVVPFLLAKKNKFFSWKDSNFCIEKDKLSTARVVFFKEFEIAHSYTLEASFFGDKKNNKHFDEKDFESIGRDLCRTCKIFTSQKEYFEKIRETNEYLRSIQKNEISNISPHVKVNKTCRNFDLPGENLNFLNKKVKNLNSDQFSDTNLLVSSSKNPEKIVKTQENYDIESNSDEILSEEIQIDEKKIIDEESFWKKIEIATIIPDEPSSGSDSEIFEETLKTRLRKLSMPKPSELPATPDTNQAVFQIKPCLQKQSRIRSVTKVKKRENYKSLNLHVFNFEDKILQHQPRQITPVLQKFRIMNTIKRNKQESISENSLPYKSKMSPKVANAGTNALSSTMKKTQRFLSDFPKFF